MAIEKTKISIIGSGNWGSAIAKIVGKNVLNDEIFDDEVRMYVYEEIIGGEKLTDIINTKHENVKYLPGHKISGNVVAIPEIENVCVDADVLIFVIPHQFVEPLCQRMVGKIKKSAIAVSLCKGLDHKTNKIQLLSSIIKEKLGIDCAVMMGANIASDIANEDFSESTIGCNDMRKAKILKRALQTNYFRLSISNDPSAVELCGALKNIVAVGVGFCKGLGLGASTQAAVIRLGLMEIIAFSKQFFNSNNLSPFFESCGVADLYATCVSGRNSKCAVALAESSKDVETLEKEILNGQKWQGPPTAQAVYEFLEDKKLIDRFPLFVAVHNICILKIKPVELINHLRNHPEHM